MLTTFVEDCGACYIKFRNKHDFNGKSDENEMAAIQISSTILPRILAEMTPISLLS